MSITLQQNSLTFNEQKTISIANDGGTLTNDAGLVLLSEFLNQIRFDSLLARYVHIPEYRFFAQHEWLDVVKQWLYQLIAGYSRDRDANTLQYDRLFKEALKQERLSSQFMM
ncbi:MAG: transposase, partial [Tetragenococcus halophilus]|nr:transposase [Tetragenococcus halophilus]